MNLNIRFQGVNEQLLEGLVRYGVANTKAEAIRMGIQQLSQQHHIQERLEEEQDRKSLQAVEEDLKTGRQKMHPVKDLNDLFRK